VRAAPVVESPTREIPNESLNIHATLSLLAPRGDPPDGGASDTSCSQAATPTVGAALLTPLAPSRRP